MEPAAERLRPVVERARRLGPLPYSELGEAGSGPFVAPAGLAAWQVDTMDRLWDEAGRPDPCTVVEVGAGDGSNAAAVLGLGPECLEALRYVAVAADPADREAQKDRLPVEAPAFLLGPVGVGADEDGDVVVKPVTGIGPVVTSLAEIPSIQGFAVVIALSTVSALAADRVEWRDGAWWEVRLAAAGEGLEQMLVPLEPDRAAALTALVPAAEDGDRFALLVGARAWLADAARASGWGTLLVVDRWTRVTEPLTGDGAPPVSLDQLEPVKQPLEPAPVEIFPGLGMVAWRLG